MDLYLSSYTVRYVCIFKVQLMYIISASICPLANTSCTLLAHHIFSFRHPLNIMKRYCFLCKRFSAPKKMGLLLIAQVRATCCAPPCPTVCSSEHVACSSLPLGTAPGTDLHSKERFHDGPARKFSAQVRARACPQRAQLST